MTSRRRQCSFSSVSAPSRARMCSRPRYNSNISQIQVRFPLEFIQKSQRLFTSSKITVQKFSLNIGRLNLYRLNQHRCGNSSGSHPLYKDSWSFIVNNTMKCQCDISKPFISSEPDQTTVFLLVQSGIELHVRDIIKTRVCEWETP